MAAYYDVPSSALADCETEDIFADLETLSAHIQDRLDRLPDNADVRTIVPAQFVKDLGALLDEWFSPIVDR